MKWHDVAKWVIIIAFCVVGGWLLAGCSGEYTREHWESNKLPPVSMSQQEQRDKLKRESTEYCNNYPDDPACRGPKR